MPTWVSKNNLKAGDVVRCYGFTCRETEPTPVLSSEKGELYVTCSDGKHFLDGQLEDGVYIGVEKLR